MDNSTKVEAPAYDKLCAQGFGKAHGEVEGSPVTKDSLSGGSMKPEKKGF